MKGNDNDKESKQLTQLEIDNILDRCINISIISRLLDAKVINKEQYYILQEKLIIFIKILWIFQKMLYN